MKNNLLKLSNTYKKYGKHIRIRNKEKEAVNKWYKKYKSDDLTDEVHNYPSFQKIILEGLLDYKLEENFEFEYPLDGRSVDFMILKDNEPFIPIELKGTATKNLTKRHGKDKYSAVEQANNYASKKSSMEWYIVSNYYEFRLYNKKSQNRYIQFTIEDLKHDSHKLEEFLLIFSKESLLDKNILNKLYDSTGIFAEDFQLENEFYKLYNETRLMFIKELEENNQLDKEEAIEYAQLILNRYIFTCFCEDKGLLPDNITTDEILNPIRRKVLAITTIWNRLNELFYFINNGNPANDITGYNGGLFKEDLSHLKIRDNTEDNDFYKDIKVKWSFPEQEHIINHEIRHYPTINPIYRNLLIISSFDFNTDLTENILGHIFENSISDLEELKNEKTSKRKKEGVYYTPEHITSYICENTIIPYLSNEDNSSIESLINEYSNNLNELEKRLHDIKILDPACGSGAFLNKATDTLLNIHKAIFKTKHKNDENLDKEFDNIDNRREILLNNIHGVDLNHESIEITKLGLFLKVCKKGLKLPDLDKNIKCGNSLINDSDFTVRPFDWEKEFHEIMANGGFDIVIGNPPYVRYQTIKDIKPYLSDNYCTYTGVADLYVYFFEKGLDIIKNNGYLGFISSNKYVKSNYGKKLRELILKSKIVKFSDFSGKKVFTDANIDSSIIIINKSPLKGKISINNDFTLNQELLDSNPWSLEPEDIINLKDKIKNNGLLIKNIEEIVINYGIKNGFNEAFIIDEKTKKELLSEDSKNDEIIKPLIRGKDVKRWKINYKNTYIILTKNGIDVLNEYPKIYNHLKKYEEKLAKRDAKGEHWYNLRSCSYYSNFEKEKIIWPEISNIPSFDVDNDNYYCDSTVFMMTTNKINLYCLTSLLNSNLVRWYFEKISSSLGNKANRFFKTFVEQIPINLPTKNQEKLLINLAMKIKAKNNKLQNEFNSFYKYLISDFNVTKINKKLTKYYGLSFEDLYKEVKKQYKQMTRREKDKLEEEYTVSLDIIIPLQKEIKNIDNEINQLVYELYDLKEDEIKIIEESFK